jgi:hypothetical protein
MRVNNKGGFTPYGRRYGRSLAALVAIAACLSAATFAHAANYNFTIDPQQSSLGFTQYFADGVTDNTGDNGLPYPHFVAGQQILAFLDVDPTTAAALGFPYTGSNVAPVAGSFTADVQPGTSIKIQPGGSVVPVAQHEYYPWRDAGGTTPVSSGGAGVGGIGDYVYNDQGKLAQYGLSVWATAGTGPDQIADPMTAGQLIGAANIYDLTATFDTLSTIGTLDGGAAMLWNGTNYVAGDITLVDLTGTEDIYSSAIVDSAGISGVPTPIGGGIDNATQDVTLVQNLDGTLTMTIPVTNRVTFIDGGTLYDIRTFGQIVATTPEPSSVALMLCGAVGLVGYVVRRKRRG